MRNTNTTLLNFGNVLPGRRIVSPRGLPRHSQKADIVRVEIDKRDTELFRAMEGPRIDAPSRFVLPVPRHVRMAGENELGRGLQQRTQIRCQVTVNQPDASATQRDLATPTETGGPEVLGGLFEVRHGVGVVVAEHKVEGEHRAGLHDVRASQVTAVKKRLGSGSDKHLDSPLRPFETVVGIGKHSELHESARAKKRPLLFRVFAIEKAATHSAADDFADPQFQLVLR